MAIYAIGDIHGQKAMLDRALALIAIDGGPEAEIVFLLLCKPIIFATISC